MEAKVLDPQNKVVIEEVNEESEAKFEHLVPQFDDHHPSMLHECSNRDKGKGRLVSDETVVDIAKQLSTLINNTYEHNPSWSKEEHEIKLDALFYAQEDDYFQKANEE